jgi:acyl-CoA thioesterase-2
VPSDDPAGRVAGFVADLAVRPAGDDRFTSVGPVWAGLERVFGGVVVAQALSAAAATVDPGQPAHSLHGHFLRPLPVGGQAELAVNRLRDGRSFSVRSMATRCGGDLVFTATCSFHRPEPGDEYQLAAPEVDGPEAAADRQLEPGPWPLVVRDLGPSTPEPDGTYRSTRRMWVRTAAGLPDDPMTHQVVAAFVSDMTGSSFRPRSLGVFGRHADASLDHALWFHRSLRMDRWVLYDLQALVSAGGRSTVRGVLFDQDGRLVASMAQELLVRQLDQPRPVGPADRA